MGHVAVAQPTFVLPSHSHRVRAAIIIDVSDSLQKGHVFVEQPTWRVSSRFDRLTAGGRRRLASFFLAKIVLEKQCFKKQKHYRRHRCCGPLEMGHVAVAQPTLDFPPVSIEQRPAVAIHFSGKPRFNRVNAPCQNNLSRKKQQINSRREHAFVKQSTRVLTTRNVRHTHLDA
jgi:hypothetical protein